MKDVQKMLTTEDVMRLYGIKTRATVWRWVKDGKLSRTKIGGRVYFTPQALTAFERKTNKV